MKDQTYHRLVGTTEWIAGEPPRTPGDYEIVCVPTAVVTVSHTDWPAGWSQSMHPGYRVKGGEYADTNRCCARLPDTDAGRYAAWVLE